MVYEGVVLQIIPKSHSEMTWSDSQAVTYLMCSRFNETSLIFGSTYWPSLRWIIVICVLYVRAKTHRYCSPPCCPAGLQLLHPTQLLLTASSQSGWGEHSFCFTGFSGKILSVDKRPNKCIVSLCLRIPEKLEKQRLGFRCYRMLLLLLQRSSSPGDTRKHHTHKPKCAAGSPVFAEAALLMMVGVW